MQLEYGSILSCFSFSFETKISASELEENAFGFPCLLDQRRPPACLPASLPVRMNVEFALQIFCLLILMQSSQKDLDIAVQECDLKNAIRFILIF